MPNRMAVLLRPFREAYKIKMKKEYLLTSQLIEKVNAKENFS